MTPAELDKRFTYHTPTVEKLVRFQAVRAAARAFADAAVQMCPPGRELSLAMTALEESVAWANAAIAREDATGGAPTQPAAQ